MICVLSEGDDEMRRRSMAFVFRDEKILIEKIHFDNRIFYTIPGGGIEEGETPEETVLRELKEECGLEGTIVKKMGIFMTKGEGSEEYAFEVYVPDDQEPVTGSDPEWPADDQPLKEVCWMRLDEISERDRAFLWSYGLMAKEDYFNEILNWGDEISYPGKEHDI